MKKGQGSVAIVAIVVILVLILALVLFYNREFLPFYERDVDVTINEEPDVIREQTIIERETIVPVPTESETDNTQNTQTNGQDQGQY